ncbi:MAG: hypothetical protein LBU09_01780 [Endomicrobium sp.]|jgi:hypothetical protein|nr:hypothetical protein [Endomicrobium sp.]
MKFLQTSRGCAITFEDGEEFAGKELFCEGEKYSNGYLLDFNASCWVKDGKGIPVTQEEKENAVPLIIEGAKKQGFVIELIGVK